MLTRVLFESYVLLVACWVVLQFALIAVWSWRRDAPAKYVCWAGFAALPLLLLLSRQVETRHESVVSFCRDMADAVQRADVPFIAARLADDLQVRGYGREELLDRLEQRLEEMPIDDIRLSGFQSSFADGTSELVFNAAATVRARDLTFQYVNTRWRLGLRRRESTWRIESIESLPAPPFNLSIGDWLN